MNDTRQSYSIIVEMENARTVDWNETVGGLEAVAREIEDAGTRMQLARPQVIFVHAGEAADTPLLRQGIAERVPQLASVADLAFQALPDGRYYELKNAGLELATGDIVVFNDSDCTVEFGWLRALLEPFAIPETVAVNGYTYLGSDDFATRAFALIWFFPLRDNDARFASKRGLNANNSAFRRDWIAMNPFPFNNGFKVSCTLLDRTLQRQGRDFVRADAYCNHYPPRGWRFLLWRAVVTGRDADRKYVALSDKSRGQRLWKSVRHWLSTSLRIIRRISVHGMQTGLAWWQIPFAILVGLTFYTLAFLTQAAMALGLTRDEVEHIPAYVEHS